MKELLARGANLMAYALSIASYLFSQVRSRCRTAAPSFVVLCRSFDEGKGDDRMRAYVEKMREELCRMRYPALCPLPHPMPDKETRNIRHFDKLVDEEFDPSPMEREIAELRDMVATLHERERKLELQLLDYCERKEQEATMKNLENNLTICQVEGRVMSLKVEALEAEKRALEAELEGCRSVAREQEREKEKLMEEVRELRAELESTKVLVHTNSTRDQEGNAVEETHQLKQSNETLAREIERLKSVHCSDLEELVYLRWVNACLRHELRDQPPPPDKTTARDLNFNLSHKSRDKAKQLVLQYANPIADDIAQPNPEPKPQVPTYASPSGTKSGSSNLTKPKFLGKLKTFMTRKSTRSRTKETTLPASTTTSSSGSSSFERIPHPRCRSDLGASGMYSRMEAVTEMKPEISPERMKLRRFAGALKEADQSGTIHRSASFSLSA